MVSETTPLLDGGGNGGARTPGTPGSAGSPGSPGSSCSPPVTPGIQRTLTDGDREVEVWKPGKSGFWATLSNTLGDIIGTGLLATPIAIAHAGWVVGPLALVIVCGATLWT